MLIQDGEERLRHFSEQEFAATVTEVTKGIWHVLGMGHSNAIFLEGEKGVILIDTLDTLERGERLRACIEEKTGKQVHTILYTHSHPDHRGGAGAFEDTVKEIIAFAAKTSILEHTGMLMDVQMRRGARQFGYALSDEENISQGIGIREGMVYGEKRAFLPPSTIYESDREEREIDGIRLELYRLPGETDDQMAVWIPDAKVLCCGDNYYGCFPNLYAIRGSQYRDIASWIRSLDRLRKFPSEYLLPGHTRMICGREKIEAVLNSFQSAFEDILLRTLEGMNQGKSADELASEIELAPQYRELPWLGEYYGCTEWTVRAIFTAYLGWFDGNPSHLHPLAPKTRAEKMRNLIGGRTELFQAIAGAVKEQDDQWSLELMEFWEDDEQSDASCTGKEENHKTSCADEKMREENRQVRQWKIEALCRLASYETSANGRHYYLASARELENL